MRAKKVDKKVGKRVQNKGADLKKCRGAIRDLLTAQIEFAEKHDDEYTETTLSKVLKKLEKKWNKEDETKA